jgi:hypothetical protein
MADAGDGAKGELGGEVKVQEVGKQSSEDTELDDLLEGNLLNYVSNGLYFHLIALAVVSFGVGGWMDYVPCATMPSRVLCMFMKFRVNGFRMDSCPLQ